MHGPELATIVFADYFRQHKLFRALQLAPGTWGGPDGGAAFLEDVHHVTGASCGTPLRYFHESLALTPSYLELPVSGSVGSAGLVSLAS